MDKLNKLPPQTKIIIVVSLIGFVFFIGWYYFITDYDTQIDSQKKKTQELQKEYSTLKQYENKKKLSELEQEREDEKKKRKENEKMLPVEDEIPSFISSIKSDADSSNLEIIKFEKADKELDDYYAKIPIKMEVQGSFEDIVSFMKRLATPKKRIVNIKDLVIEKMPVDITKLEQLTKNEWMDSELTMFFNESTLKNKKFSPAEKQYIEIKKWQAANKLSLLKAKFIAYTFTYTGKPMPEDAKKLKMKKLLTKKKKKS